MPKVRRHCYTQDIPPDAVPATVRRKGRPDAPGVQYVAGGEPVLALLTTDGRRCRVGARGWYGDYRDALGVRRRVPLDTNKAAAEMRLSDLVRKVEQEKVGVRDAYTAAAAPPCPRCWTPTSGTWWGTR